MSSPPATPGERTLLAGWGRTAPGRSELVECDAAGLAEAVRSIPARGAIARGLGRSYGDAAQCSGGRTIRLTAGAIELDADAGTVTAGGGVSLDEILTAIVPRGWFVPVTPGTRYVTVGGAIASDIHGKNHHADGSFGDHVTRITLMLADASVVEVGPDRDPALFWATVGGMGLTGIVVDATFRLIPIATSLMAVDTRRIGDLDALMAAMADSDGTSRYSVAWLDLTATGRHLGRGVLTNGAHAPLGALAGPHAGDPLRYGHHRPTPLPPVVPPPGLINRASVRAFNEVWYRKAPTRRDGELTSIPAYFHPLDGVAGWNRVYGRQGFVQYQFVVPFAGEDVVRTVVRRLASLPIFLTVLKRFGPGNAAPLSFPTHGWTLAVDIPSGVDALADLLRSLDELVLGAGGRHYLAKDHIIGPDAVRRGYPRLDEWLGVRAQVDPEGVWASDLARRLDLVGPRVAPRPGRTGALHAAAH